MSCSSIPEKLRTLPVFVLPQQLINVSENGKLKVVEETIEEISKVSMPLNVIAIAGLYRTGKSYLMNRLARENTGFALGHTIEAKTKGIWCWCRPHPIHKNTVLLLLDTEGLGNVDKGDSSQDNKIFTLATLLCNVLVYNISREFNNHTLEKLSFVSEMSRSISSMRMIALDEDVQHPFPIFVMCIRDCTEEHISADEYLEHCLDLKPGRKEERLNRTRKAIRKYFPVRKCFMFDRPASRGHLQHLESIDEMKLAESFTRSVEAFRSYVHGQTPNNPHSDKPITGSIFGMVLKQYVHSIQDGTIPDIDEAVSVISMYENQKLIEKILGEFNSRLSMLKPGLPNAGQFKSLCEGIQHSVMSAFKREFISQSSENRVKEEMQLLIEEKYSNHLKMIYEYCIKKLQNMYDEKIGRDVYTKYRQFGGFRKYKDDIEQLKAKYRAAMSGLEETEVQQALNNFMKSEMMRENEIKLSEWNFNGCYYPLEFCRMIAETTDGLRQKYRDECTEESTPHTTTNENNDENVRDMLYDRQKALTEMHTLIIAQKSIMEELSRDLESFRMQQHLNAKKKIKGREYLAELMKEDLDKQDIAFKLERNSSKTANKKRNTQNETGNSFAKCLLPSRSYDVKTFGRSQKTREYASD